MVLKILIPCVVVCFPYAWSNPVSAVSRYGSPALSPGFTHFPYANAQAPKRGTLRLSTVGTFDSLNHMIAKGIAAEGVLMTYDPLMKRAPGEPFTLYGLIAEKVDLAPDASSVIIYIHDKARFHDGAPITAEDIIFTIELLRDKGLPRYKHHYTRIKSMEILAPKTLKITFVKGDNGYNPELPFIILMIRPLSKASLQGKDFQTTGLTPLMGSGSYRIKSVEAGRSIIYERFKGYWAKDHPTNVGHFNFDEVHIDYYKNVAVQFQAFLSGEFDVFFDVDPNHWHTAYTSIAAVKSGEIERNQIQHERPVAVRTIIFNMRRPHFADARLRKALMLAFDFDTLNKMIFFGSMKRPHSLFSNTVLAHQGPATAQERKILESHNVTDPSILDTAYQPPSTKGNGDQRENLGQADQLLKEAGWVVVNGKRIQKDDPKKEPLTFEFLLKDPRLEKIALSFKQSLAKLGITLNVRLVDSVQYESRAVSRDFDMIIHTWTNPLSPGNEQSYYFGAQYADIDGSSNYIGVKNATIEALAKQVSLCATFDELKTTVHALDRLVMHQNYMIPLAYDDNLYYALWKARVAHPALDPKVGLNVIEYGWAPEEATQVTSSGETKMGVGESLQGFVKKIASSVVALFGF